jgi:hypothetical protein
MPLGVAIQRLANACFGSKVDILLPEADIRSAKRNGRYGPKADIASLFSHLVGAYQKLRRNFQTQRRACYFGPLATHAWKYSRWASLIPCALVPGLGVGWAAMAAFLHTRASSAGIGEDRA